MIEEALGAQTLLDWKALPGFDHIAVGLCYTAYDPSVTINQKLTYAKRTNKNAQYTYTATLSQAAIIAANDPEAVYLMQGLTEIRTWPPPSELGFSEAAWFSFNYGVADFTVHRVYDYASNAAIAFVVAHNDCEAAIGVELDDVSVYQLSYGNGSFQYASAIQGAAYSAIHRDAPGPAPGEEIWSGWDPRYATTGTITAGAQQAPNWFFGSTYGVTRKRLRAVLASKSFTADVTDYQVAVNTLDDDTPWDSGPYNFPSPHGSSYGTVDADWEVFVEAPAGVCSEGVRDISLQPSIMVSAIFNSYLGDGTPEDIQNLGNDGFSAGHSFVGWA